MSAIINARWLLKHQWRTRSEANEKQPDVIHLGRYKKNSVAQVGRLIYRLSCIALNQLGYWICPPKNLYHFSF